MNKRIAAAAVITAMTMLTACGEATPAETETVTSEEFIETAADTEAAETTNSETSSTEAESVETESEETEASSDITDTDVVTDNNEKYSAEWAAYLTEDYIKELSAAVWENTTNNMDSTVNNADTYFSDVNMDGVPEFVVSCEGVEHDSLVQIFTITDTGVSLLYETTRFYGVYDIDGITSCCGIKPNYDTDSWDVVNLCNNDIVFTAVYESDSDLWDSYESYITKDTAVREYLSGYTQLNSVSETVPLDFRGIGMDTENVLSEYITAILEK